MYSLAIHLYAFVVALISPFHKKARLMRFGQWKTNSILREKIDRNAKYIWFHASSLGEFEQGRPMIEKIKAEHPEYKVLLTFFSPSGYEVRKNYKGADVICYLPFDTPFRVKKFLNLANPRSPYLSSTSFGGTICVSCGSGEYRFISFPLYSAPTSYFSNGSENRTGRCYLILIIFLFRTSVR